MKDLRTAGFSIPVRAAIAAALAALAAVVFLGLPSASEATSHSAEREFSSQWVLPGGDFSVTITFENLGIGQGAESLPEGFTYVSSDQDDAVELDGQTLTFFVFAFSEITYTVTAPETEGEYIICGCCARPQWRRGADWRRLHHPRRPASDARPNVDAHEYAHADTHEHAHTDSDAHVDAHP